MYFIFYDFIVKRILGNSKISICLAINLWTVEIENSFPFCNFFYLFGYNKITSFPPSLSTPKSLMHPSVLSFKFMVSVFLSFFLGYNDNLLLSGSF